LLCLAKCTQKTTSTNSTDKIPGNAAHALLSNRDYALFEFLPAPEAVLACDDVFSISETWLTVPSERIDGKVLLNCLSISTP
jgi:hypothetical protein